MTLMTAPPDPAVLGPLDADPAHEPAAPPAPPRRRRRPWLWTLVTVVALVLLAVPLGLRARGGLTAVSPSVGAATREAGGGLAGPATRPGTADTGTSATGSAQSGAPAAPRGSGQPSPSAPDEPVTGPKVARSAWLGLKVSNLIASATSVRAITDRAGGQVLSEDVVTAPGPGGDIGLGVGGTTGSLPDGSLPNGSLPDASLPGSSVAVDEAQLGLRVPTDALDRVLVDLSGLGTVSYRSSRSTDVTDSYVDTTARIQTMEQAVRQARELLAKATDLGQIIDLENEVTRRQADLDSLRARLADLERRTTTADVTVTLWTSATERTSPSPSGFLGGLHDAWTGLLTSVGVIVTGLAVLLPWLLVAVVVALPIRAWLRRRRGTPTGPAGPSTAGPD